MKKFFFIVLIIFLVCIGSGVFAETFMAEVSDNNVFVRKTADNGDVELKTVAIEEINGFKYFGIRQMTDSCGAIVEWDDLTKSIKVTFHDRVILFKSDSNDIFINGNKYNFGYPVKIIDGVSYAPLDVYKVFTGESILFDQEEPGSIPEKNFIAAGSITLENGVESDRITISVNPADIVSDFKLYNPPRLVIDIRNMDLSDIIPTGSTFHNMRQYKGPDGITRIVFDLTDDYEYIKYSNANSAVFDISASGIFRLKTDFIEYRNNSIIIKIENHEGYIVSRSSDPFTINIELPEILTADNIVIPVGEELISEVTAKPSENGTIISIATNVQCSFELEKSSGLFVIGIYEPVVKNAEYYNSEEINHILLKGIEIGNDYTTEVSDNGLSIKIRFENTGNSLTAGQIYINDGNIKSIFTKIDGTHAELRIEAEQRYYLSVVSEENASRLYLNKSDNSGKLVVISAGHGGRDPGAVIGDLHEADLNLIIANKLQMELTKLGIDTFMIRTDDTFIGLEERAETANRMNAALFISIHANTLDDTSFDGLMTLVHSGYLNFKNPNGKTAGTIIHKELITITGATDRGVRDRDKIIVLKETAMPAVEIEAGFLTNETELGKLLDDAYQNKIAVGAAVGIEKVLNLIGK